MICSMKFNIKISGESEGSIFRRDYKLLCLKSSTNLPKNVPMWNNLQLHQKTYTELMDR